MPPIPAAIPHDATGRLTADLPCIGCGYNLIHQHAEGACSECGRPIWKSLATDRLWFADEHFLNRITHGTALLAIASALMMLVSGFVFVGVVACGALIAIPIWIVGAALLWSGDLPGDRRVDRFYSVSAISFLVLMCLVLVAIMAGSMGTEILFYVVGVASMVALLIHLVATFNLVLALCAVLKDSSATGAWWMTHASIVMAGLVFVLGFELRMAGSFSTYALWGIAIVIGIYLLAMTVVFTKAAHRFNQRRQIVKSLRCG